MNDIWTKGLQKNQNHRRWNKNSTIALLDKIILCYVLSSSSACCFKKSVVVLFKNYLSVLLPRLITITATAKRKWHLQKHKRSYKSEKKIGQVKCWLFIFVESDEPRDQDIAVLRLVIKKIQWKTNFLPLNCSWRSCPDFWLQRCLLYFSCPAGSYKLITST